jgi:acetyl esterase/lipase
MRNTRIVLNAAAAAVVLFGLTETAHAARPVGEPHVYKTVEGSELKLYVTKPADWNPGDARPAIVFFHGGGWVGGSPGQFTEHSKYLASRGMVAVQVQYRLLERKDKEPPTKCIADAKSAMRWVRSRNEKLGIDPQRIASAGGSAGGHLAAFVGMVEGLDDPADDVSVSAKSNALVLFNPVLDNGPKGYGFARVGDDYKRYSPFHNVSADDPPGIFFLGSEDRLIPVETAHAFQKKMRAAGVDCEVMIFEGQPHGFFNHGRSGNKCYYETVLATDKFLQSLGWLKGPATIAKP